MNILDAIIIIGAVCGIIGGLKKGIIKSSVALAGTIVVIVIAFYLKNPVAKLFYTYLPFFSFKGPFSGVSVINILLYELIAFLLVASILSILVRILVKMSGILEKALDITIVLGFVSKVLGAVFGFLEAYLIMFIILFFLSQPLFGIKGIKNSKISEFMLTKTPGLNVLVEKTKKAMDEITILKDKYNVMGNNNEFNYETLDTLMKYEVITVDSVKVLKDKNKIKINGIDTLIEKYGGK
ncbi:MAG: CvpA family protein [Bacilli bacterium]